jgi:hypothetical protein
MEPTIINATNATLWETLIDDINATTNNARNPPNDESPSNSLTAIVSMTMLLLSPMLIYMSVQMVVRFARPRHEDPNALIIPVLAPDSSAMGSRKEIEHNRLAFIHQTLITHTGTGDGLQAPVDNTEKEETPDEASDEISVLGSINSKPSCSSDDVCLICLASFHRNSIVCGSNNPACCHQYHEECMISWLMKHDVCPMCRERYLIESV